MSIQADGAGITAFRDMQSFEPAPLLNFIVRGVESESSPWSFQRKCHAREVGHGRPGDLLLRL